jgi:molybdopterin converting factor small subunit
VAHVVLQRSLAAFVGAPHEFEVEAENIRALLRALEARFPGIAAKIEDGMSVAIDGELFSDPFLEPIDGDSEVHFLPRLQGG